MVEDPTALGDTRAALWATDPVGQAGWYRCPEDPRGHRHWDGVQWDGEHEGTPTPD